MAFYSHFFMGSDYRHLDNNLITLLCYRRVLWQKIIKKQKQQVLA